MNTPDTNPRNDPLRREIDDALEGVRLQEEGLPPLRPRAQAGAADERRAPRGRDDLRAGTVVDVHGSDVIVELGPRMQGVVSIEEFDAPPAAGETFEFSLHGQEDGLWILSRRHARVLAAWRDLEVGALVKVTVAGTNPGGLECEVGPIAAFLPASHVSLRHEEDLARFVGETLVCQVIECDRDGKRAVVSRRAVLERERREKREELFATLAPGAVLRGKVTRVESFGAFVDIGGSEGLVHVSNLSRRRVDDPREVVDVGQEVEVQVLEVKEGGRRIGLGMKQLEPDPWDDVEIRYRVDQVVPGRVVRIQGFGAFMELEPGLEGLLHVSQLGGDGRRPVQSQLKVGEEIPVRIQAIDTAKRRLSLTRLDSRGQLLGSEDAVEAAEVDRVLEENRGGALGTNLGSLFKKALGGD